ncbi:hypothetical protein EJV47_17750 [Hymenobacter gummosus]|uniref:Uncharacterized protein n=1 Tax=Hymenobacter gummosus TaxID=1776032 RepID=A0A431TZA4_9BACT|nr:hypothetical protein [Hymenobacter gummosus]RTQ47765.1 hypothetical protein EJV47_17750 [Hymenobacter gummosus]
MIKHFRLLLLCGGLALGGLLPASAVAAQPAALTQVLRGGPFDNEYDHGFYDGEEDAKANKCNYANNPGGYEQWYYEARQWAWYYMQNATSAEMYDFWFGYYSGLESGYYTQVVCGSPGPGGGGPIDNPGPVGG